MKAVKLVFLLLISALSMAQDMNSSGMSRWCESIYHVNPVCPLHGQVEIPQEWLDEREASHLEWCDSIYHQNVDCPLNGQIEIPQSVLDENEAAYREWCESIDNQNSSCQ